MKHFLDTRFVLSKVIPGGLILKDARKYFPGWKKLWGLFHACNCFTAVDEKHFEPHIVLDSLVTHCPHHLKNIDWFFLKTTLLTTFKTVRVSANRIFHIGIELFTFEQTKKELKGMRFCFAKCRSSKALSLTILRLSERIKKSISSWITALLISTIKRWYMTLPTKIRLFWTILRL